MTRLEKLSTRALPLVAAGLLCLLALWIMLVPAEAQLGSVIKLVYIHGALVWVGLLTFSVAGILGLAALLLRRPVWYRGTGAAGSAALIVWSVQVISSMLVTGLTWGPWIAWNEPRVRATALILAASLVLAVLTRLLKHPDLTAMVNVIMGIVPWMVIRQAGVLRHPVNPIGSSESESIQILFLLVQITTAGLAAVLVAWLWVKTEHKHIPAEGRGAHRPGNQV